MYESFFGLREKPFSLTPDPGYFYLSEGHREALAALTYGVRDGAGLITLTGPVGVGKTMVLASFLSRIRGHAEAAAFSGEVSRNRTEFLRDLCSLLGIVPEQETLFATSQAVKDFAMKKTGEGRSVVVLVDEAQDLGPQELDHFHHLSNLETPEAKLLQIVLAGTDKLDEKLQDERVEALWQRVAIRCVIRPIEPEESVAYIFHRLRIAGASSPGLFSDDALWRIVNFAGGVPRLINLICNQAMISAYSSGRTPVDEGAVAEALREIEGSPSAPEAEEVVARDEIRSLVEAAERAWADGPSLAEEAAGFFPGEGTESAGGVQAEVTADRRRRRPRFFFRFKPGRRLAVAFVLILLLALVGFVMTVDLPVVGEGESGYPISKAGLEASNEDPQAAEPPSGLLPLRWPEEESGSPESSRPSFRDEAALVAETVSVEGTEGGGTTKVQEEGVARIALEHYGRLNGEILQVLREKNPQIRDWNDLTPNVRLVLPDVPASQDVETDFYTIQVGAFREGEGVSRRLSDLAEKGAQNLFLVRGGEERGFTFVCVGVFESGRQSSQSLGRVREWGFHDAFPVRIQGERLEDILQPQAGLASRQEFFPGS